MKLQCTAKCVINGSQYSPGDVVEISQATYDLYKVRFDSSMKVLEADSAAGTEGGDKPNPLVERKHIMNKLKELGVIYNARATNTELRDLLAKALDPKGQPTDGNPPGDGQPNETK